MIIWTICHTFIWYAKQPRVALLFPALLAFFSSPAFAQLQDENILMGLPDGYVVGHQDKGANGMIVEMVPQGETVENWTQMVTMQIFFHRGDMTPQAFEQNMQANWSNSCPNSQYRQIRSGAENGYSFSFWLLDCPLNSQSGKPETTFFKAIQGNDAFYVVQKAFRGEPTKDQIVDWTQLAGKVQVCDTRLPEQACPEGM